MLLLGSGGLSQDEHGRNFPHGGVRGDAWRALQLRQSDAVLWKTSRGDGRNGKRGRRLILPPGWVGVQGDISHSTRESNFSRNRCKKETAKFFVCVAKP